MKALHESQKRVFDIDAPRVFVGVGRLWGKTTLAHALAAARMRNAAILYPANTKARFSREGFLRDYGEFIRQRVIKPQLDEFSLLNDATVLITVAERGVFMGHHFDGVILDEAGYIHEGVLREAMTVPRLYILCTPRQENPVNPHKWHWTSLLWWAGHSEKPTDDTLLTLWKRWNKMALTFTFVNALTSANPFVPEVMR